MFELDAFFAGSAAVANRSDCTVGDALTGVIAALIGQHVLPFDAARLGAWLCGRASEIAISHGGESEESLTPSRMLDFLGAAFRNLRAGSL